LKNEEAASGISTFILMRISYKIYEFPPYRFRSYYHWSEFEEKIMLVIFSIFISIYRDIYGT